MSDQRRETDEPEGVRFIGADQAGGAAPEGERPAFRFDVPEDEAGLPHWTAAPTGEVPKMLFDDAPVAEDLDWTAPPPAPRWRDGAGDWSEEHDDVSRLAGADTRVGALVERDDDADLFTFDDIAAEPAEPPVTPIDSRGARRADPRATATTAQPRGGAGRPPGPRPASGGGRNMPLAVGVAVALGALFLVLCTVGPGAAMVMVTAVLVVAAAEFYAAVRQVGYHPATLLGLAAVASLALGSYWKGDAALGLVSFLAVVFALLWFMLGDSEEQRPVPNLAITMLGIAYVGVLGSFAALLLKFPNGVGMLLGAVAGTAAYDVGGLFVGMSAGRSRLAPSVSPNKTYEGLIGGMVLALGVCALVVGRWEPWGDLKHALALGAVVAIAAPLGDLCESMVKRDLGIKDMGTVLPGHGGVLDRFDALLFVLPSTYYLVRVLDLY